MELNENHMMDFIKGEPLDPEVEKAIRDDFAHPEREGFATKWVEKRRAAARNFEELLGPEGITDEQLRKMVDDIARQHEADQGGGHADRVKRGGGREIG